MANGSHLSPDFVGYDVGVPSSSGADVGFVGLLDFTGLPVGISAVQPATVGFVSFLDFTGLPVGVGEAPTPPIPPTPLPSMAGGGISYDEFRRRKRKKGDEEILFL